MTTSTKAWDKCSRAQLLEAVHALIDQRDRALAAPKAPGRASLGMAMYEECEWSGCAGSSWSQIPRHVRDFWVERAGRILDNLALAAQPSPASPDTEGGACIECGDHRGWTVRPNWNTGDAEQVQCRACTEHICPSPDTAADRSET